jgi:purine-binding chemotaxis protein CheW
LVAFELDTRRFALSLSAVERVVPVAEITPLPGAPEIVPGVINIRGQVLPVFDIRRRFGLPARKPILSDQLIIAKTSRRPVALWVDLVGGVLERTGECAGEDILEGLDYVEGVVKLEEGLILIHNLERFLSLEEEAALDGALAANKE